MADESADIEELFSRLESCFQDTSKTEFRWEDIKDSYVRLKEKVKDPNKSFHFSSSQANQTNQVLSSIKLQLKCKMMDVDDSLAGCISAVTELLRFLRNAASRGSQCQDNIMTSGIIENVIEITNILLKPVYQESSLNDKINHAVKSAVQLLGNIVVGNIITQDYIWSHGFPDFFHLLLTCGNHEIQNCACMVMYNCFSSQRRKDLVSSQKGLKIIAQVLHMSAEHDNLEWGFFMLEAMIANGHVPVLYQGLEFDPSARIFLLDLIQAHLTDVTDSQVKGRKYTEQHNIKLAIHDISEESIVFLAHEFEQDSKNIFDIGENGFFSPDNMMNAVLFTRLLKLLSRASALQTSCLQNRNHLLCIALDLLHQANDPANRSQSSKASSFSRSQKDELSPSHGFKQDLVTLIGNMCFDHKANQDTVREREGIPLLLDHCNIDDNNPYICQWAVFALRNILKDNVENQQIVASLDRKGTTDLSRLHQLGIDISKTNDGKVKIVKREEK